MSQSFAHDGGAAHESSDEQIAAEIADHLAAAAEDLQRRGEAEDQAAQLALARFGDVARVTRQCWWIHNGEQVMFRTAGIALLSLLTILMAVAGFAGWRLQRDLASRTEELSVQLASLTSTQQAMLDQQRPPAISGLAYLGDPSKPAKDVEIQVFKFSEEPPAPAMGRSASGVVTRRLRTDADGHFDSGVLQPGEYCVLAPLMTPAGQVNEQELLFKQVQSRPLSLTAGLGKSTVELNLAASGQLRLATIGIPNSLTIGAAEVRVSVAVLALTDGMKYFERRPVPPGDEPPRDGWPLPMPSGDIAAGTLKQRDSPGVWWLSPRDYSVRLQLTFSPPGPNAFGSHPVSLTSEPLDVKLAAGDTAMLTLSVPGDPLQQRVEAAWREYEKNYPMNLGIEQVCQRIFGDLGKSMELKVDLAIEEARTSVSEEVRAPTRSRKSRGKR